MPKDVVFLVDTSGSQSGAPLEQCQTLLRQFINGLNPADTFSILDFSDKVRQLSKQPLPNTAENRKKAIEYINKLCAGGATEMLSGIRAAIDFPAPLGRLRTVVFLSDGYIGNENQVLAEVQQHLKSGNRLYSFGAGSSVNRFLLDRIAEIGRGLSRIVRHDEPVNEFVEKFFKQINNPVLVNLEIIWQGEGETPVIYPSVAPDLFAEQPLVLFGKKGDRVSGILQIKGVSAGGHQYVQTYEMNFSETGNPAVAQLWGRHRIKDLMNQMLQYETKVGVETVTETALAYQLLSQYTAFVAVSDDARVEPGMESISVNVPVEMPEAVEYKGVFGNKHYKARAITIQSPAPVARFMEASPPGGPAGGGLGLSFESMEEPMYELAYAPSAPPLKALEEFEELEDSSLLRRGTLPVEIVSVEGLDRSAIASLNEHLETLIVPPGIDGELVLEIVFGKVRPSRIVVDADASTVTDVELLKTIKKWLFSWHIPHSIEKPVRLTLRVRS